MTESLLIPCLETNFKVKRLPGKVTNALQYLMHNHCITCEIWARHTVNIARQHLLTW